MIKAAQQFRHSLISEFCLLGVDEFKTKIFDEATVDCDVIFAQKKKLADYDVEVRARNSELIEGVNVLSNSTLLKHKFFNLSLSNKELLLLDKINSRSWFVKDYFDVKNGVKPYEKGKGYPPQTKEIVQQKPYTAATKLNASFQPLIGGSYFNKYVNLWNGNFWISYGKWLAAPREESIFKADEKLIIRQTSDRIIATLIPSGFIIRDNTHIILKKNPKFSLQYLLGILNSKLVDFVYTSINPEKGEALAQVKVFHLEMLPFYPVFMQQQAPVIKIVDRILAAKKSNPNADTTALEKEIDRLIYQRYELTEEEIKIVEGEL
ncbi:MAG: hypothetical protein F6K35_13085 [Okeania sp. SIO2H7]|nr:hypothetical protein [Okeania sp. SIO2H7]